MFFGSSICVFIGFFFFQAEDGIRDLVRSRGLGDVYKRQDCGRTAIPSGAGPTAYSPTISSRTMSIAETVPRPVFVMKSLSLIHI